jgi:hypothetical protein
MRAALVAARHERRLRAGDLPQRVGDVLAAGDLRGVGLRSDQDEVVVHDVAPVDARAFGDELVLGGTIVHEHDVRVAAAADVERLAGADRDDLHGDAGLARERGKQVPEQARLLGRGRRRDDDRSVLREDGKRDERRAGGGEGQDQAAWMRHGSSPSR